MKLYQLEDEHGDIKASLEYFEKFAAKNATILDIGCRYGSFIYNLYKRGYHHVQGIDINAETIKKGREAYPEIKEKLTSYHGRKLPYQKNSFGIATMWDVIEHLPDPERYLKNKVYPLLEPSGRLIFQTPNKYLNIIWEVLQHKSFTKWKSYHVSLQTPKSLRRVLKNAGFSKVVIEKRPVTTDYNKQKVKNKLGKAGIGVLNFLNLMPLSLTTNLWGYAEK
jgi:2-polyprenyl-3-methyl-5-hydroxy-6-metoxy-1,4-benzoquinol methylase